MKARKTLTVIIITVAMLLNLITPAQASTVTGTLGLYVRAEPYLGAEIVGSYAYGDSITIYSNDGTWCSVYGGYVLTEGVDYGNVQVYDANSSAHYSASTGYDYSQYYNYICPTAMNEVAYCQTCGAANNTSSFYGGKACASCGDYSAVYGIGILTAEGSYGWRIYAAALIGYYVLIAGTPIRWISSESQTVEQKEIEGQETEQPETKELSKKELKRLRQKAVKEAWEKERAKLKNGEKGQRDWTPEEKRQIIENGKADGYEGHHIKNVNDNPGEAGNPDNIQFLKGRYHPDGNEHLAAHGGNYANPTDSCYTLGD